MSNIKYFNTVTAMQADSGLSVGDVLVIGERGDSLWDVITATTNNTYDILDGTSSSVSVQLRIGDIVHVKAFGAYGDTSLPETNDYVNELKRVFAVSGGGRRYFSKKQGIINQRTPLQCRIILLLI